MTAGTRCIEAVDNWRDKYTSLSWPIDDDLLKKVKAKEMEPSLTKLGLLSRTELFYKNMKRYNESSLLVKQDKNKYELLKDEQFRRKTVNSKGI